MIRGRSDDLRIGSRSARAALRYVRHLELGARVIIRALSDTRCRVTDPVSGPSPVLLCAQTPSDPSLPGRDPRALGDERALPAAALCEAAPARVTLQRHRETVIAAARALGAPRDLLTGDGFHFK